MKVSAVAIALLACTIPVDAAKPEPFAYAEWENGVGLFFHEKCPVANAKDWQFAIFVEKTWTWSGCWVKEKAVDHDGEVITLCPVTKNNKGEKYMPGGCLFTEPSRVYKGNPIPQSAF